MIFLWRAWAVTPRLTRGIAVLLSRRATSARRRANPPRPRSHAAGAAVFAWGSSSSRIWRRCDWLRLRRPPGARLKRLAAARLVLIFGISGQPPLPSCPGASFPRRQHHRQPPALHFRILLDLGQLLQVPSRPVAGASPRGAWWRISRPPEPERHLRLVAVRQEPFQVAELRLVIGLLRSRPELDLLDLDLRLLLPGGGAALALLEEVLPEVPSAGIPAAPRAAISRRGPSPPPRRRPGPRPDPRYRSAPPSPEMSLTTLATISALARLRFSAAISHVS